MDESDINGRGRETSPRNRVMLAGTGVRAGAALALAARAVDLPAPHPVMDDVIAEPKPKRVKKQPVRRLRAVHPAVVVPPRKQTREMARRLKQRAALEAKKALHAGA